MPFVRWMQENGRPLEARLRAADLSSLPYHEPDRPIAVFSAVRFLLEVVRAEGPDIGCRVVTPRSIRQIGSLGRITEGVRTPREALARISAAMPRHCTHEHFLVADESGMMIVREFFALPMDDEILNIEQQYVAAIIKSICASSGARGPLLERIELVPHPEYGLDHLRTWFEGELVASQTRALVVSIRPDIADRPSPILARGRRSAPPEDWQRMSVVGDFAYSARIVIAGMFEEGSPSIERLARAAGLATRTLQRRLADEGTSFSELLEEVRRTEALRLLKNPDAPIGQIAAALGYRRQASISRAVRRWTGATPRNVRSSRSD